MHATRRITLMPIRTFRRKDLQRLYVEGRDKRIPAHLSEKLLALLDHLNAAATKKDLNLAGFHELKGARKGSFAWKVTGNWRLTFRFENGEAFDVDLEDYH
jgi:toxin HigB-1